jgi:hypothetical protein
MRSEHDPDTQPELPLVDPFAPETLHAGDRHEVFAAALPLHRSTRRRSSGGGNLSGSCNAMGAAKGRIGARRFSIFFTVIDKQVTGAVRLAVAL